MKLENILIIFLVQNTSAWLFDLDLNLNSALCPGGAYTANKCSYLQDSFRSDVLAPTMMGIEKELKANRRNDFIVEALLAVGLLVNIIVSIYLLIKTKYLLRRIRNKYSRIVVVSNNQMINIFFSLGIFNSHIV